MQHRSTPFSCGIPRRLQAPCCEPAANRKIIKLHRPATTTIQQHRKHDSDHVWLLNPPRRTRCRGCLVQALTFSSRAGQGCGAMRATCVVCMQLQLPLQNSNARFRPCSVKLNSTMGVNVHHDVTSLQSRSHITIVIKFSSKCQLQLCLRMTEIFVPFGS